MRTVSGPPRSASEGILWAVGGGHRTALQVYTSVQGKTTTCKTIAITITEYSEAEKHKSDRQNQNYRFNVHAVVLP